MQNSSIPSPLRERGYFARTSIRTHISIIECIIHIMSTVPMAQQLREFFACHHHDMVCAYLYGSQAQGKAGPHSDVDIAILLEKPPPPTLDGFGLDLGGKIEENIGKPVDLVILNRAPVDLIHRILRDGILVYEGDPAARIRFEVRTRGEYFDLLPYLRQYRRSSREHQA